ncbi:sensor domain-containing protein [Natrinema sp. 1APR25-10V2]|uniref:sensor domain-containing protein n=1 Tax=Natrinema sp. 1APR25-10V2 TaxID=2951081 RepID=UPI002874BFEF|nr:sensor domain-containing protein [Natrinema sp. 1APR25-10V2]MDS0476000.1 sensor domain-containing protein [Natrinema sp. 1APR25-10V2]
MSSPRTSDPLAALARVRRWCRRFVGVVARRQTYYTLLYLLLAFPLGVGYFTMLVTGFALPAGFAFAFVQIGLSEPLVLLIAGIPIALLGLGIGLPAALVTLFAANQLAALERRLAERLLEAEVPTAEPARSVRERARRLVVDRGTWKGVIYLFSKFFYGTAAFVALTVGVTFTYALVAAPLHYRGDTVGIHIGDPIEFVPEFTYQHEGWTVDVSPVTLSIADGELLSLHVDSLPAALVVSAIGVLVGLVVLHLFNAVGWLLARYAELLLGNTQPSVVTEPPWE